jgi:acetolactate synthase-1/2/3 large subunit
MNTAQLLVRILEAEGVPHVFGVVGEENIDLVDALEDSPLRYVGARNEQGAAFMANVQGRLSGRASACLSTLGPGATNLVTGVADANMDRAPLVAITGQAGVDRLHKESHQVLDLVSLFQPITKYSAQVARPETAAEIARKAFKLAQTEKYGAAHISIPEDVAAATVEGEPIEPQQPRDPEPLGSQIERAVDCIEGARRPVILAGNGAIRGRATEALRRFAHSTNMPVANTLMAKGVLSAEDPLALLSAGLPGEGPADEVLRDADVVIAVGYDLVEYAPERWNPNRDKRIVHIDRSPAEVDAHYQLCCGIQADLSLTLEELSSRLGTRDDRPEVAAARSSAEERRAEQAAHDGYPVLPQRLLAEVRSGLEGDDVLISDVGAHKMWIARDYPCYEPNTCIISNGFASMGIALPGSIGAKLRYPERRVVSISGDGGFLMNVQELETAVREEVPVVAIVWRDEVFRLIEWKQLRTFGRSTGVRFNNPDLLQLAESFGCAGYRVEAASELGPILKEALAAGRPAVIDCPVDSSENLLPA